MDNYGNNNYQEFENIKEHYEKQLKAVIDKRNELLKENKRLWKHSYALVKIAVGAIGDCSCCEEYAQKVLNEDTKND